MHCQIVNWILQYLQSTINFGSIYDRSFNIGNSVIDYVDYDYVGDINKRKYVIEYVFTLLGNAIS